MWGLVAIGFVTAVGVRGRHEVAVVVRDVPVPPFESLEQCTEAYNHCMDNDVTTEPEYAPTTTTPEPTTTTPEPTTPPPPPMRHGEVGQPDHIDAKLGYKPPLASGNPDEQGFDYNEHGDDWTGDCKADGQSPIDIVKYVDLGGQTKSVLWFDYYQDDRITSATEAHLVNNGHGLTFEEPQIDLGFIKVGADEFEAYEYTVHTPSEHTIDGQTFPLEIQVLHKDAAGKQLGVAVLFKYGASNPFMAGMKAAVPAMPKWTVENGTAKAALSGDVFNLENILPMGDVHPGGDMTFYNYQGSLTAPPCTGGVSWWVSAEPMEASKDEIANFRTAVIGAESTKRGNNRAAQPLDGRKVLVGHTGFQHHMQQHGHKKTTKPDSRGYSSQDAPWKA